MSDQMIPLALILDPEWNSRIYTDSTAEKNGLDDLSDSMKQDGQLQAIEVEGPANDGSYVLILGSRRLRAAKLLGWTEIRATVNLPSDTTNRVIRNILENVKRKDLTSFEQARACVKLRECGMTAAQVGDRLGFSKQKVSNLAVSYSKLPPAILLEWQAEHPCATVDFLRELASVPGETEEKRIENIMDIWRGRLHLREKADNILDPPEPDEDDEKGSKGKTPAKEDPPYKVPHQRYFDLVRQIQKSGIAGGKLATECLRYAVGETDVIKGLIEPAKPEAAPKAVKKSVKKAA